MFTAWTLFSIHWGLGTSLSDFAVLQNKALDEGIVIYDALVDCKDNSDIEQLETVLSNFTFSLTITACIVWYV